MDRVTETLVDGLGVAAATSGILTQQQARIFALLYAEARPLSLDGLAAELPPSQGHLAINIRVLVEWHLVRRKPIAGSRKDHYEAATDFFRAFQEIFERRFRWTVRQVIDVVGESERALAADATPGKIARQFAAERLASLGQWFGLMDEGIQAFVGGEPFPAHKLARVVPLARSIAMNREPR